MAAAHGDVSTPRVTEGIGARLYVWRSLYGIPLHQVSRKSGCAYSMLWAMETQGHVPATVSVVERLAEYMDVSPAWLLWGVPAKCPECGADMPTSINPCDGDGTGR